MATDNLPSPELLRQLLEYAPETGVFTWRHRAAETFRDGKRPPEHTAGIWNTANAGKQALTFPDGRGYYRGKIMGRNHKAHRVAWAIYHGVWPDGEIDHINGERTDNRIANLRVVSRQENSRNKPRQVNNTSGATGVARDKQSGKWSAWVKIDGKNQNLGLYHNFGDAVAARKEAERKIGFHANHGR